VPVSNRFSLRLKLVICCMVITLLPVLCGQKQSGSALAADGPLAFDVATIKPQDQDPRKLKVTGLEVFRGGRVTIHGAPLTSLICTAYDLSYWQLDGVDKVPDKTRYEVEAKPPEESPGHPYDTRFTLFGIGDERLRRMLQTLLAERFHLRVHRESREGAIMFLEVNGKTLRLKPSKANGSIDAHRGEIGRAEGRGLLLVDTTMAQLAAYADGYVVHRPVLDRTGLQGGFDFESKNILTEEDFQPGTFGPSFLSTLTEMGLKLQPGRGQVERLVIDHSELPTPD